MANTASGRVSAQQYFESPEDTCDIATPRSHGSSRHSTRIDEPFIESLDDGNTEHGPVGQLLSPSTISLRSSTPTPSRQQQHHESDEEKEQTSNECFAENATRCRSMTALSTIGQAALDLTIASTSIYFVVFAIMAHSHEGQPVTSGTVRNILDASRFGPTIWPIMFSAIVGRFLTSIATWRLEHGVDVASMEYLIGCRTVFGAVNTPLRLRILHYALPLLVTLWALSPLGGQAALRVVSSGPEYTNETVPVSYLDSLSPFFIGDSASTANTFEPSINAVFVGALIAPKSIKKHHQDLYGNLKIPLLEDRIASASPKEEGWYYMKSDESILYSSLVGLPVASLQEEGSTFLNIETSYLYPTCTLSRQDISNTTASEYDDWENYRQENLNNGPIGNMVLDFDSTLTEPRKIVFGNVGIIEADTGGLYAYPLELRYATKATCAMTTTYVEVQFVCEGKACTAAAIRESRLSHVSNAATWLDGLLAPGANSIAWPSLAQRFYTEFINASNQGASRSSSALERFLMNPDAPFSDPEAQPALADVGETAFSHRFAQLLNTYLLANTAPLSVTGNFSVYSAEDLLRAANNYTFYGVKGLPPGHGLAANTTATLESAQTVLVCNIPWLVVLAIGSTVMFLAGLATTFLNLVRKGPEILDSFTSLMRDSPFVHVDTGASTEDAADKARRLRKVRVMLGDVRAEETIGYVALGQSIKEESVQKLRSGRMYS